MERGEIIRLAWILAQIIVNAVILGYTLANRRGHHG
jgi:hypothetical protein